jgi:hypothetical protein
LAEEKFSESTVPSGAVGKAFADGFYVFADGFGHSAKDLFPVVVDPIQVRKNFCFRSVIKHTHYDNIIRSVLLIE